MSLPARCVDLAIVWHVQGHTLPLLSPRIADALRLLPQRGNAFAARGGLLEAHPPVGRTAPPGPHGDPST
eukprot:3354866-Prymnesium_polylepis.1